MGNFCEAGGHQYQQYYQSNILKFKNTTKPLKIRHFNADEIYIGNAIIDQSVKSMLKNNQDLIKKFGGFLGQLKLNNRQFQDSQFDMQNHLCYRVSKLYSGKPKSNIIKCKDIQQKVKQYTYLSSVFYFLTKHPNIIHSLYLTQVNELGFSLFNLYPKGNCTHVVIDDRIPVQNNDPKYGSISTYNPWFYLIQKAWAKMIGSYQNAKGLSPEDVIQELLGIPAYSFSIIDNDYGLLKQLIQKKDQLIVLTAKSKPRLFYSHQVLYVQQIDSSIKFHLQSPYKQLDLQKNKQDAIVLTEQQVRSEFQFITIGYYKENFINSCYTINFKEQGIYYSTFEITKGIQQFSLRIVQIYQKYIDNNDYMYSPVYIKLFQLSTGTLLSQGCRRSQGCVKSANLFEGVMQKLKSGTYFLVIQIEWIRPDLISEANIVFYGSHQISNQKQGKLQGEALYRKLMTRQFGINSQISNFENLQYCTRQLKKSILIMIKNNNNIDKKISIKFPGIKNLKSVDQKFIDNNTLNLTIKSSQIQFVEFRKVRPDFPAQLSGFHLEIRD